MPKNEFDKQPRRIQQRPPIMPPGQSRLIGGKPPLYVVGVPNSDGTPGEVIVKHEVPQELLSSSRFTAGM